jgi:wobble nucleotide-excising tRNase
LRNSQIRQEAHCADLCQELLAARAHKQDVETQKASTRQQLITQAESLLASYETDINRILGSFGASFRLQGTSPSFAGGRASSTYKLSVNNAILDVGDASTPRGVPCFRSVLSAGDKSALALAFFLARLARDKDIAQRIVVFDDPLTSLDAFRTSFTQQSLVRLAQEAKQVIVLSHDPFFLKGIADLYEGAHKSLRLARAGATHTIKTWDIHHFCLNEAHKDYFLLRRFVEEGLPDGADLHTVARAIRPYIEGYLRHRFPDRFSGRQMLGQFIQAIDEAAADDELAVLKAKLQDLTDINGFARRIHHGPDGGPPAVVSETEVKAFCERALSFVRG